MAHNHHYWRLSLLLLNILLHISPSSSASSDVDLLLSFKQSLSNNSALTNWNKSMRPCSGDIGNWVGVLCSKGNILGLQLENMGLAGQINIDSLIGLPFLRTLSFMNNNLEGAIPDIKKIFALKSVFMSNNRFNGTIPSDAFADMAYLKKVHLAQNEFSGNLPQSLTALPRLLELRLEGNQFGGLIPDFKGTELKSINLSNNAFEGQIPIGLSKFNLSSFQGNKGLCGRPLDACPIMNSTTTTTASSKKPPIIIFIIILIVTSSVAAIGIFFIILRRCNILPSSSSSPPSINRFQKETSSSSRGIERVEQGSKKKGDSNNNHGRLSFVRTDRERFDLPDLLRASAEILGSGCFGSSYKANLTCGSVMVVKRFRQMNNVEREEFQEHMRRLGRLRHSNLLPLVAYYYRKEEKLLISDFVQNGCLAVHLHGGQPRLTWPMRLKIIKGVAKGLLYLYNELPNLISAHGHLKSSNVILDQSFEPLLSDYGLIPVINQEHAHELMVAYKSPEYIHHHRVTKKTDVWSLGMLILEILTARFPANCLQQGRGSEPDLASWTNSVACPDWMGKVIDGEMGGTRNGEGEIVKLLKIGLNCCEEDVGKRLDLREAVERIEEVRERDDDDFHSSYASEGDVYSIRGLSDDFSSSVNLRFE